MERNTIFGIWSQLTLDARRSLHETLGEMLGASPAAVDSSTGVPQNHDSGRPQRRIRVWERDIIRDVPIFAEFGQMTAAQRGSDQRGIPRLLSIATGVVSRGVRQGIGGPEITQALLDNLGDHAAMQALYPDIREERDHNMLDANLSVGASGGDIQRPPAAERPRLG
jgi:hypothetical protein